MAVAFVNKGTFASGSGTVAPGIPASMVAGDLMVLVIHSANEAITGPTGWTADPAFTAHSGTAERGTGGAAGGVMVRVFTRWWQSGDAAPTVADTGNITAAIILGFRDVDSSDPFDSVTPVGLNAAASTTHTLTGVTTNTNGSMIVHATALDSDATSTAIIGAATNANLTSLTERHDQTVTTNNGGGLNVITGVMATAGASGNTTTAAGTSTAIASIAFALKPATIAPGIDSYTVLMLHGDGSDASTTFTDDSGNAHTFTATGNAQIDTAQSKFGGASMLFDGTGDYLAGNADTDFSFGTGDFTIDFWVRMNGTSGERAVYSLDASSNVSFDIYFSGAAPIFATNGTDRITGGALSNTTWYHIALTRSGNDHRLFVDGVQVGSTYTAANTYGAPNSGYPRIGSNSFGDAFPGWIDELRVSKGIARWTATFGPPTEAYTASSGTTATLTASVGAITLSSDVDALIGASLSASIGNVTLASDVDALIAASLSASIGDVALTAAATTTAAIGADLTASVGDIALTSDADVLIGAALSASVGAITLASDTDVLAGAALSASVGDITLASDTDVLVGASLSADIGEITLSGAAAITVGASLSASMGDIALTSDVDVLAQAALESAVGEITLEASAATDAGAGIGAALTASIGDIILTSRVDALRSGIWRQHLAERAARRTPSPTDWDVIRERQRERLQAPVPVPQRRYQPSALAMVANVNEAQKLREQEAALAARAAEEDDEEALILLLLS